MRDKKKRISEVAKNVGLDIQSFTRRDNLYSRGLASEGYNGGYRDALYDVMLFLNGVKPDRCGWWD